MLFILIMCPPVWSTETTLYITGNINGAMVDCNCGETKNGSLARLITFYKKNYSPNQIWLDAGNFTTSYQFEEFNQIFINSFSKINYLVIALGSNELLKEKYLFKKYIVKNLKNKILFSNSKKQSINQVINFTKNGIHFKFINLFINKKNKESIYQILSDQTFVKGERDKIIILFLQGNIKNAENIFKHYPEISGIIIGNNREDSLLLKKGDKKFILAPGLEAEKIGVVQLNVDNNQIKKIDAQIIDLRIFAEEDKEILEIYNKFEVQIK